MRFFAELALDESGTGAALTSSRGVSNSIFVIEVKGCFETNVPLAFLPSSSSIPCYYFIRRLESHSDMSDTPQGGTAAVQANPTARDLQQTQDPLPALIRPYDAKRDQKLTRYLIGAGVMEP